MLFFGGTLQFSKKYRVCSGFNGRVQNSVPAKNPTNAGEFSAVYFSYIIAFCFRIYCYYGIKILNLILINTFSKQWERTRSERTKKLRGEDE
jgi:hypothetical protein